MVRNICYDCDERLIYFNKLNENLDFQADSGREETPIIVDDDVLLYDLFFAQVPKKENHEKTTERQFLQQQQQQQLQQNHLHSSDYDTEVIELLSSRESTPINRNIVKPEKIVAFVDLANDFDNPLEQNALPFGKCEVESSTIKTSRKRKRNKTYNESELIVLAKLNLVSSDSEADEVYPTEKRHSTYVFANTTSKEHVIKHEIKHELVQEQTDLNSLGNVRNESQTQDSKEIIKEEHISIENEIVRERVKCPICQLAFNNNQFLVHHVRIRHRDNEEETQLRERVRHARDSALTIRLCYQSCFLYYECQLCGRIDNLFKEHKEHVLARHTAELRSLKDPLLKKLQCPLCKRNCGTQYIELCRHLLDAHTRAKYEVYLKEIKSSDGSQQQQLHEVSATGRIYKFYKRQHWFIQCKQCGKVSGSIFNHRKHVNELHAFQSPEKCNEKASCPKKKLEKEQVRGGKQKETKQEVCKQLETIEQTINLRRVRKAKRRDDEETTITKPRKYQRTPKVPNSGDSVTVRRKRGRPAGTDSIARSRAKLKLPVKQVQVLTFFCNKCQLSIKGFCAWNLHILNYHKDTNFYKCSMCEKFYQNDMTLRKHMQEHNVAGKQSRKNVGGACVTIDENSNATKANCCKLSVEHLEKSFEYCQPNLTETKHCPEEGVHGEEEVVEPTWLNELIVLHNKKYLTTSGSTEMKPNTAILEQTPFCKRFSNMSVDVISQELTTA